MHRHNAYITVLVFDLGYIVQKTSFYFICLFIFLNTLMVTGFNFFKYVYRFVSKLGDITLPKVFKKHCSRLYSLSWMISLSALRGFKDLLRHRRRGLVVSMAGLWLSGEKLSGVLERMTGQNGSTC